jgi:3-oxoadipate enol-lactonase
MPFAESDGAKLHFEEHGSGEPLLLIMGLGYTKDMWHRLLPAFAERYRVIVFDNRGVGESDVTPGPYTTKQLAADAAAILDAADVETAHVLGASLGGMIAQEFALSHPRRVRSLVLCCTTAGGPNSVPAEPWVLEVLQQRASMPVEEGIRASIPFTYDPGTPAERIEEDLAIRRRTYPTEEGYRAQLAAALAHDASGWLERIRVPTLVVHGETDQLVPTVNGRRLAELIPAARLAVLPNAGHIFFTDQPERATAAVLEFLDAVSSEGRG